MVSEVPYNIDAGFREKALENLQAFQRGDAPERECRGNRRLQWLQRKILEVVRRFLTGFL